MKKLLILVASLLMPFSASAAISVDSMASTTSTGDPATLTITNTNSGDLVNICITSSGVTGSNDNIFPISSVTVGGTSAVMMASLNNGAARVNGGDFLVPNIGSGSKTISVTGGGGHQLSISAVSYSGANTTIGWDATSTETGSATSPFSMNLTPGHANDWVISCLAWNGGFYTAAYPSGSVRSNYFDGGENLALGYMDSNGTVAQSSIAYGATFSPNAGSMTLANISIFPASTPPVYSPNTMICIGGYCYWQ